MASRMWLLAPAALLYLGDIGLTLGGQPAAYWAGDHGTAVEFNPVAHPLLARSPWLFLGLALLWLAAVSSVVVLWRHPLGGWVSVILAVGHAVGGASWLERHGSWGLAAAGVYLVVAAQGSAWCWRRYGRCVDPPACRVARPIDIRRTSGRSRATPP